MQITSHTFKANTVKALADVELQRALGHVEKGFIDKRQTAVDALVAGLRGIEGLDPARLHPYAVETPVLTRLRAHGLLHDGPRLALTPRGFDVVDAVTRSLADALVPVADRTSR